MSQSIRSHVDRILAPPKPGDRASQAFNTFMLTLIFGNIVAIILETEKSIYSAAHGFFRQFEIISVIVFTTEYLLRLWSCTSDKRFARPILGRIKYILTPMALIDLLAVLPFFLTSHIDLRFVRGLRLFRLFRIAKIGRYSEALHTMGAVIRSKKEELIAALSLLLMLLVFSSSLMYFAEHESNPNQFPSIPASMWWSIVTLTTVGYGDICPITILGKVLAGVIAVCGVCMLALPTGLMGAAFVEEMLKKKRRFTGTCPRCGYDLDAHPHPAEPPAAEKSHTN